MKFYEYILNSFKVIEQTQFCQETATWKIQRYVTQKVSIQELWFLHSITLVNMCMKFHEDTLTVLKLHSGHDFVWETATYKVPRGINQKV